jgi:hypothetical protein
MASSCEHGIETSGSIKDGEFLDFLRVSAPVSGRCWQQWVGRLVTLSVD